MQLQAMQRMHLHADDNYESDRVIDRVQNSSRQNSAIDGAWRTYPLAHGLENEDKDCLCDQSLAKRAKIRALPFHTVATQGLGSRRGLNPFGGSIFSTA